MNYYNSINNLITKQDAFYGKIHVNEYITRAGQEPTRIGSNWTIGISEMEIFGICEVVAASDYGSEEYIRKWETTNKRTTPVKLLNIGSEILLMLKVEKEKLDYKINNCGHSFDKTAPAYQICTRKSQVRQPMAMEESRTALCELTLAIAVVATSCGGAAGGGTAAATAPTAVASTDPDPEEQEQQLSDLSLAHVRAIDSLQAQSEAAVLKATGASLSTDLLQYTVYLNDKLLDSSKFSVSSDTVSVHGPLAEGRNDLRLFAPDSAGSPVESQLAIWAGSYSVAGRVVDDVGNPVPGVVVTAALGADSTVTATTTSDVSGNYVLKNFPGRTVLVFVTGPTRLRGSCASVAGTPFPDVVLPGPSPSAVIGQT